MRTFLLVCIFISLPFLCEAQFMGVGGQYSQKSDGQFFVDVSYPVFKNKNPLNIFISSGVDYTTYGGAKLSGLNIKPIRINTFFSEDFFNRTRYTVLFGVDAGYLFNFPHGRQNSIVVSPNLYFDYKVFFIKTGYDIDTFHGENQFFVRAGVCFGLGSIKMFAKTKIW